MLHLSKLHERSTWVSEPIAYHSTNSQPLRSHTLKWSNRSSTDYEAMEERVEQSSANGDPLREREHIMLNERPTRIVKRNNHYTPEELYAKAIEHELGAISIRNKSTIIPGYHTEYPHPITTNRWMIMAANSGHRVAQNEMILHYQRRGDRAKVKYWVEKYINNPLNRM